MPAEIAAGNTIMIQTPFPSVDADADAEGLTRHGSLVSVVVRTISQLVDP